MNEPASLGEMLQEWRQMGELEGAGIQSGHWDKVAQCQRRKSRLQEIITASLKSASDDSELKALQGAVRELIAMELRNSEWISQRRQALMDERARAQSASGNLRRVRSAYGEPSPLAVWNSYS